MSLFDDIRLSVIITIEMQMFNQTYILMNHYLSFLLLLYFIVSGCTNKSESVGFRKAYHDTLMLILDSNQQFALLNSSVDNNLERAFQMANTEPELLTKALLDACTISTDSAHHLSFISKVDIYSNVSSSNEAPIASLDSVPSDSVNKIVLRPTTENVLDHLQGDDMEVSLYLYFDDMSQDTVPLYLYMLYSLYGQTKENN